MTNEEARSELENIMTQADTTDLEKEVAQAMIDEYDGDVIGFTNDLLEHGCASGIVSNMIYYKDTHVFAKKHIEEILELKGELEEETGLPIHEDGDKLNWLAWFGFEETVHRLANRIGLEV